MKISRKKLTIACLIIIILAATGVYPVLNKSGVKSISLGKSNDLSIYTLQVNGKNGIQMQTWIDSFKKKYPNIKIKETPIGIENNQYSKQLLSDSLAGNGPDVLYFDSEELNVHAMQKSQILADLKPFIEKDKDFDEENYNKAILNAGKYNGKMTFIPLDYYVNNYITTDKLLKDNNIKLKDNMSQNDFIEAARKYASSINGSKSKTLFAYPISITDFIASSGIDFIDYENKKTYFNKPEFRKVIDNYKTIYNSSPKQSEITATSGEEGYDAIKEGTTLFSDDRLCLNELLILESKIKGVTGETQIINNIPTYDGGDKVIAMVGECMAINKSSKNKEAAYNFIKTALSTEIKVKSKGNYVPLQNIPAGKKFRDITFNQYLKNEVGKTEQISRHDVTMSKPSNEFQSYYDKITQNIQKTEVYDPTLDDLMMKCLTPYLEGKESYDSGLKNLQEKVKVYLNE